MKAWRYDSQTNKRMEEALEREYWSSDDWKRWRENRLAHVLHRAARRVPFYRELWNERRRKGFKGSSDYLENWPILEKQTLRQRAIEFVADDMRRSSMFCDHTSGTTGTPVKVWSSAETLRNWYALFEARTRKWFGVTRSDRWAILGGQLIVAHSRTTPPFWVWNAGMRQLYMSSYHLRPNFIAHYLDALRKYRIRYVLGYSSSLYELARGIHRNKLDFPKLDVILTNAEPLYDHQRELISSAFECPVKETYGMAEMVGAASECGDGQLHEWPDAGIIERSVEDESDRLTSFICTGLVNEDMPLIRYRVGDSGTFGGGRCGCGRTLPIIKQIEGRNDDLLLTRDGRRVGRLDPIFKANLPILEAQIVQKSLQNLLVRLVPDTGFTQKTPSLLAYQLRERMGDVNVEFEIVDRISRTNNGKFKAVVCELGSGQS